jgi:hypothetical protein
MLNGGNMDELIQKISTIILIRLCNHKFIIIIYSLIKLKILGVFIIVKMIQLSILVKMFFNTFLLEFFEELKNFE